MARQYSFRDGSGNTVFATSNGNYFTEDLRIGVANAEIYYEFYSDAAGTTPVTPTGGTIVASGTPLGNNYLEAGQNATTQASQVEVGDSTYTPPVLDGLVIKARVALSGIAGAAYMRATLYKHD